MMGGARRFLDAMRQKALGEFCAVASPGQDPPDRVRPLCGGRPLAMLAGSANRRPLRSWASPSSAANRARDPSNSTGRPGATACGQKLKDIKAELRRRMHQPIPTQGLWLKQVVTGHFAYYAVPTNSRALSAVPALRRLRPLATNAPAAQPERRLHVGSVATKLVVHVWLPQPRILHPWPDVRFDGKHPR